MRLQKNISLKPYNTFGIEAVARYFVKVSSIDDLRELINSKDHKDLPWLVLGGGSNILLTSDFPGVVIKIDFKGIEIVAEDDDFFHVRAGAGENWHQFVLHCIEKGYAGLENLSLIPGNVGASPMQNIGAYGVEVKDVFSSLEAVHRKTGETRTFNAAECEFGYRESVFKGKLKDQYIIYSVTYKLRKDPVFNTSYGAIEQELENMGIHEPSIRAISNAVINIRRSKLPDPLEIGNAGSFFKNPVVPSIQFGKLKEKFPDIVGYPVSATETKVAAGWLIENTGWKGKTINKYGVHSKQALVLVNYGGATGAEIFRLSEDILSSVHEKFGIQLEREVNIL